MMPLTPFEEMICFILELILLPIARRTLFHLGNVVSDDTWDLICPWLCNGAVKDYIRSFVEWSPYIAILLYIIHRLLLRRGIDLPTRLATYRRLLIMNITFTFGDGPQNPEWWLQRG